jgi:hypothetical protein
MKTETTLDWQRFKTIHSKAIVNYVESIKGKKVTVESFVTNYLTRSSQNDRSKRPPCVIKRGAKKTFSLLQKYGWIQ